MMAKNDEMDKKIIKVSARTLLNDNHIDIYTKMKYVEYRLNGGDMSYICEVYAKTIEAFSFGTYQEPGKEKEKNSLERYFEVFNQLIEDIKTNGFDATNSIIPIGPNGVIQDGAHRIAIAAYLNIEVPICQMKENTINFNTTFFKQRLLAEEYLDYTVREYCCHNKDIYVALLWPRAIHEKTPEVLDLVRKYSHIVYQKEIMLTYQGIRNLMIQIYEGQLWLGNLNNHFSGTLSKVERCYSANYMTVLLLKGGIIRQIRQLKEEIRRIYGIGDDSVHITDTYEEAMMAANLLFHHNSITFLNHGRPDKYKKFFLRILELRKRMNDNHLSWDRMILDSSAVMSMYGIREAGDIDFCTDQKGYEDIEDEVYNNNNNKILFHKKSLGDLLYNPNNYFIFMNMKFITLKQLYIFKKNRGERKDLEDLKLIKGELSQKDAFYTFIIRCKFDFARLMRNMKVLLIHYILRGSKFMGIYHPIRKMYHQLRDK